MGVDKVKKVIYALLGATAIALIPLNANAASEIDSCEIVNNGVMTINYDVNAKNDKADSCHIVNNGTLTIASGANIYKNTRNQYAPIDNYGTLNITGGTITANRGSSAVYNHSGNANISGGTVRSVLHQAVMADTNTSTKITGGQLIGAIGGEETVYTTGNLTYCNGEGKYNEEAKVDNSTCPAKPAASTKKETITITINTSKKTTSTPVKQQPVTTTKNTATKTTSAKTETIATVTPETKAEEKPETKKVETTPKTTKKTAQKKEAKNENQEIEEANDVTAAVLATAAAIIIGSASIVAIATKRH